MPHRRRRYDSGETGKSEGQRKVANTVDRRNVFRYGVGADAVGRGVTGGEALMAEDKASDHPQGAPIGAAQINVMASEIYTRVSTHRRCSSDFPMVESCNYIPGLP